jgi:hypothetical protein
VLGVRGPVDGMILVDLGRDGLRFSVMVTRLEARTERPLVKTDRYAIYAGHADPPGTRIPEGAIRAITHKLARRIGETEHELPLPAGM